MNKQLLSMNFHETLAWGCHLLLWPKAVHDHWKSAMKLAAHIHVVLKMDGINSKPAPTFHLCILKRSVFQFVKSFIWSNSWKTNGFPSPKTELFRNSKSCWYLSNQNIICKIESLTVFHSCCFLILQTGQTFLKKINFIRYLSWFMHVNKNHTQKVS